MNIHIHTAALTATFACSKPATAPRGAFARFLHELDVDGCTVLLAGAAEWAQGVQASVAGDWFCGGGKKG